MVDVLADDLDDGPALTPQVPVALAGAFVALIRSVLQRKSYIRLAAAAGTEQIKMVAEQGMLNTVRRASAYVLSPEEMAQEEG